MEPSVSHYRTRPRNPDFKGGDLTQDAFAPGNANWPTPFGGEKKIMCISTLNVFHKRHSRYIGPENDTFLWFDIQKSPDNRTMLNHTTL